MPTTFIPFVLDSPVHQELLAPITGATVTTGFTKLSDTWNGYFDILKSTNNQYTQVKFVQRPMLGPTSISVGTANADNVIRNLWTSLDKSFVYWILTGTGGPLFRYYSYGVGTTNVAMTSGWSNANTQASSVAHLDGVSYGSNAFVITDFAKGALISAAGVWTEITDATYTALTPKTNIIPMDGYLFCGEATNNRIYNSDLNSPTVWDDLGFLTAAATPGKVLWLQKLRNYLLVFKEYSIEFFENVGNPAPGSPLEAQKQFNIKIGLASKSSIQEVSDGLIFVGLAGNRVSVYKIDKLTLRVSEIADARVLALLNSTSQSQLWNYQYNTFINGTYVSVRGTSQVINHLNKEFYSLVPSATQLTYLYDNQLGVWTRWFSYLNTLTGGTAQTDDAFIPSQCNRALVNVNGSAVFSTIFAVNWSGIGSQYATSIGSIASSMYTTTETNFEMGFTTEYINLGSNKRKFLDSLELIYEPTLFTTNGGITTGGQVNFRYFENSLTDSTVALMPYRSLIFNDDGTTRLIWRKLGSFRKRAFSFSTSISGLYPYYNANMAFYGLELTYNDGETDQS